MSEQPSLEIKANLTSRGKKTFADMKAAYLALLAGRTPESIMADEEMPIKQKAALMKEIKNQLHEMREFLETRANKPKPVFLTEAQAKARLDEIEAKIKAGGALNIEDLRFIYRAERYYYFLSSTDDKRIDSIRKTLNTKKDIAAIYEIEEEQIIDKLKDLVEDTKVYLGDAVYYADKQSSFENIEALSEIRGFRLNLSKIDQAIKEKLTFVNGRLADSGNKALYTKLERVGGHLAVENATEFTMPALQSVGNYIDARRATEFTAPALQSVGTEIDAKSATEFIAPALQSVGRAIEVQSATEFTAPALQSVGGYINAESATEFTAPVLQSVGSYLNAPSATEFTAPVLQSVGENLDARRSIEFIAPALQSVGGYIDVESAVEFSAPVLRSVYDSIFAQRVTEFLAPVLQNVGRILKVDRAIKFTAPVLQSVGGYIYVENTTEFTAPALESVVWNIDAQNATKFNAPNLINVRKIILTRSKIKDSDIILPEATKAKIEFK